MKYKLIMLPNPILVSDEQVENNQWRYNPHTNSSFLFNHLDIDKGVLFPVLGSYKIIAGIPELPSIDFSGLTEEDCERIGWVDVEKLVKVIFPKWNLLKLHDWDNLKDGFTEGFKVAQSLNEKKFSEDDLKLFAIELIAKYKLGQLEDFTEVNKIIESYSQPKVFDVELEMELRDAEEVYFELNAKNGDYWNHHFHHYDSGKITIKKEFEHIYSQPKITSNSIKISKVL